MTFKTSEGVVVTDPGEAEVFNNLFSDVFTSDNGCPSVVERIGVLSTVTFTPNLVKQVLKKTKAKYVHRMGLYPKHVS